MSSLSNFPYGKILDYWYEKLSGNPYRRRFILTKIIEIFTFKSYSKNKKNQGKYVEFPSSKRNLITENAKICIVIPVYIKSEEDKQNIINLLKSIDKQILKPYKVIVIDDNSPYYFDFPQGIVVHRFLQNFGPAKARNKGKQIALEEKTDIIAFTDSDCILSEDWLLNILNHFLLEKEFNILSGNTPSFGKTWFDTYHNINGTLNGRIIKCTNKLLYGTTANLAITKEVANSIDFNENFPTAAGEDIDFCFRANIEGFGIGYIPQMIVFHNYGYHNKNIFKNICKFRKQFKKYGKGENVLLEQIPNYYQYFDKTQEIPTDFQ